jgi:hypothetical protein
MNNAYKTFVWKPEQNRPIESLGKNGKIILNRILKEQTVRVRTKLNLVRVELVEDSCKYCSVFGH